MNSHLLSRLGNMALRGLTLACRLLLILLLARFLPAQDVGLFGLFFISVNFGLILVGLNFHSYSNREAISADRHRQSQLLFNQLALYLPDGKLVEPRNASARRRRLRAGGQGASARCRGSRPL